MSDYTLLRGKKNIFDVIVYKLSVRKKYYDIILKIALKVMVNKGL